MAVPFAAFLPVLLLLQGMRAHFITPLQINYQASSQSPRADLGDWVLSSQFVDRLGKPLGDEAMVTACPPTLNTTKQALRR